MVKNPFDPLKNVPDVCPTCGQNILKSSAASVAHHSNPERHLPYTGKKKRVGWR